MCEVLGNEPNEEDMPMERSDLSQETQMIFNLYDILPERWEGFSGQYLGKELYLLPVLFEEFDYDSYLRKYAWSIIPIIDNFVAQDVAQKIKQKSKQGKVSGGNNSRITGNT